MTWGGEVEIRYYENFKRTTHNSMHPARDLHNCVFLGVMPMPKVVVETSVKAIKILSSTNTARTAARQLVDNLE